MQKFLQMEWKLHVLRQNDACKMFMSMQVPNLYLLFLTFYGIYITIDNKGKGQYK